MGVAICSHYKYASKRTLIRELELSQRIRIMHGRRVRESESKNQVRESRLKSKIGMKLENQNPLTKNQVRVSELKIGMKLENQNPLTKNLHKNQVRESESSKWNQNQNRNQVRESESGLS